jgi:hypothetical protein
MKSEEMEQARAAMSALCLLEMGGELFTADEYATHRS